MREEWESRTLGEGNGLGLAGLLSWAAGCASYAFTRLTILGWVNRAVRVPWAESRITPKLVRVPWDETR